MRGHPLYDKETGRSDGLKRVGTIFLYLLVGLQL